MGWTSYHASFYKNGKIDRKAECGEWNGETYPLINIKAAIVDGQKIKADTWYTLTNGEFVECD